MNDTNLVEPEMEGYIPDKELGYQEESVAYNSEQFVNDEKVVVQEEKRRYKGKGIGKKSRPAQQPIPDPVQQPVPQATAQEPQHLLKLLGLCTRAEADSVLDPQLPEGAREVQLPSYYPKSSRRSVERFQDITMYGDHSDMEVDSTVDDVPLRCTRCFLCHTGTCDDNILGSHPGFEMLCSSDPWMVRDQSCQALDLSDDGRTSPFVWNPLANDEFADDWQGRIPGGIQRGPRPRSMEVQPGTPQPSPELSPMRSPLRSPARSPLGSPHGRSSLSPERGPRQIRRRSRQRSPIDARRPVVALRAYDSSPGALKRPIPSENPADLSPEPTTSTGHKDVRFPYYTRVVVTPPPRSDDDDD